MIQRFWACWWKHLWKSSLSHFLPHTSSPSYLGRRGLEVSKCGTHLQKRQVLKGRHCSTNLIFFYDRGTHYLVRERLWKLPTWAAEKPLAPFPTLFSGRNWLHVAWTVQCSMSKNWLNGWAWRGVVNEAISSWQLAMSGVPWGQFCLISLSTAWVRGSDAASQTL